MATQRFPLLNLGEKRVLTFRFADELEPGETLSGSATVSVSVVTGTDGTPANLLNGSATVSSPDVLVPVFAQAAGVTYDIKVLIGTTTSTKKLGAVGRLQVE